MSPALICYLIGIVLCVLAALGWRPGQTFPIGLAFGLLGHVLAGVVFKAV